MDDLLEILTKLLVIVGRKCPDEIINVQLLAKGEEKYIFLYTDEYRGKMLGVLGEYARNPDLSFNWYHAAVLSQKIRVTDEEK